MVVEDYDYDSMESRLRLLARSTRGDIQRDRHEKSREETGRDGKRREETRRDSTEEIVCKCLSQNMLQEHLSSVSSMEMTVRDVVQMLERVALMIVFRRMCITWTRGRLFCCIAASKTYET